MTRSALLLLHGLGGTAAVWDGLRAVLPPDVEVVAPDLPGHGTAAPLAAYSFAALAEAVAAGLDGPYAVLGHSLGGVVALELARAGHATAVVGLGIKVAWSEDDLARAAALAGKPARTFATREEALDRHLAVSGLRGLVGPDDAAATTGVRRDDEGWRLALDPRAFGVGAPDLPGLLRDARCPVVLARGEHDPMVSEADLRALGVEPVTLPGLGHSAHVEDPPAVRGLLGSHMTVV
ncbi:MAG: alpha/beta hydrolase [Frankiales bacterium]|nr:MAG: alpha/beta hydrolase [Frankiales bacterium]